MSVRVERTCSRARILALDLGIRFTGVFRSTNLAARVEGSANAHAERIAACQASEGDAFLISSRAGDVCLSLTVAERAIHVDP